MIHHKGTAIALLILTTFVSSPGYTHQKGDMLVRTGAAYINPRADSDQIELEGGIELGKIDVDSITVPLLTLSYFGTDHLAFEVLLGMPPEFDIGGTSGLLDGVAIGTVEAYPIVVTAQYYPLDPQSRWQPFAGIGFNYVIAGDTEIDPDLAPLFGADNIELDVENSWGLVLSVGLDYILRENITLSAEAYYMDVTGKADGEIIINGQALEVDLFARTGKAPILYSLTIGYIF